MLSIYLVALYYDTVKDINCTIKLIHLADKQIVIVYST